MQDVVIHGDEKLIFETGAHRWCYFPVFSTLFLIGAIGSGSVGAILIGAFLFISNAISQNSRLYVVTSKKLRMVEGVLAMKSVEIPLSKINEIGMEGWLLPHVTIRTGNDAFHRVRSIANADQFRAAIVRAMEEEKTKSASAIDEQLKALLLQRAALTADAQR